MRFPYKVKDFKTVQKNFDYLQGRINSTPWETITWMTANWVAFAAAYVPQIRVDVNGMVYMRGLFKCAAGGGLPAGSTIGTIPPGKFFPEGGVTEHFWECATTAGSGGVAFAAPMVVSLNTATGVLAIRNQAVVLNDWLSINPIFYKAPQ